MNNNMKLTYGAMYRLGLRSTELSNYNNFNTMTNVEFTTKPQIAYT